MDRKYITIAAVLLVLLMYQPAFSEDSTDTIESSFLESVSDIDSNVQLVETLSYEWNMPIPQNNTVSSKNYSKMTKYMSVDEKKEFLKEYMKKYGYSMTDIGYTINSIEWSEVTEDLAPSFYTAIEKGYMGKYINFYHFIEYYTNEKAMSQMNNLIEYMLSKGHSDDVIKKTINNINWSKVTKEFVQSFAPSFYTAVEKGYIGEYIDSYYFEKYYIDEKIMSKANKVIDAMRSKGYSKTDIKETIRDISWDQVTEDFAPSFYTAVEKGYIARYIGTYASGQYCTDEIIMSNMNNVIAAMLSKGYSNDVIKKTISYMKWSNLTKDLPSSFYTALDKGYVESLLYNDFVNDEKTIDKINQVFDLMASYNYKETKKKEVVEYISNNKQILEKPELSGEQVLKEANKKIKTENVLMTALLPLGLPLLLVYYVFFAAIACIPGFGPAMIMLSSSSDDFPGFAVVLKVIMSINPMHWVFWNDIWSW